jgi:hypothetical protein
MRSAATAKQDEENDGADDGDKQRTETAEAIREEGKHLSNYARALSAGSVNTAPSQAANDR